MFGGPSSLRTAAVTLGCALVLTGSMLLLRETFTPRAFRGTSLLAADEVPPPTTPVTLGSVETDHDPLPERSYKTASLSAELIAEIEPSDIAPSSAGVALELEPADEKPDAKPSSPSIELLDVQPQPPAVENSPRTDTAEPSRHEEQLARIAAAMEALARQALLTSPTQNTSESTPAPEVFQPPPPTEKTALIKIERTVEDRDRFSMEVRQAPVADVLAALCELAGQKLELAGGVTGRTTITLRDVTLGDAINTLLQHTDLGVEHEEKVLRVMPRVMAENRALHRQPVITRRYQPKTVRAVEALPLIRPLLTPRIGRMTIVPERVSTDCLEPGRAAPKETLVIVDRAAVHDAITKLLDDLEK